MGTRVTSDKLGFDVAHRPGALARYFARRWLSAKGEGVIAWLLEAALGKNAMYFIEKTKEYVDAWGGSGEVVPVDAFDGFVITGDPVEDTIIPHAVLVWTCMNDGPWQEEVYHQWLDELLAAGSAEAAYLAASLWPAHDLMEKVTYRPARWLVYRGQLDAEAERLILTEMLKGVSGPRTSLYGSFEYDDVLNPEDLPRQYIERHGFTHPICGLVGPGAFKWDGDLKNRIQEALAAPSWSEGMKGAAMLLYLSLKAFNDLITQQQLDAVEKARRLSLSLRTFKELSVPLQELLTILEKNLFKLDERHINIINFHMDKTEKIDYNLIKDYINLLIILYNKTINEINLSTKMFSKYISIGLRTNDILYIGKYFRNIIFKLILRKKEKVELWLEKQVDDLRIRDALLALYMTDRINYGDLYTMDIKKELKTEHLEKKIKDIFGKIKYFDKIRLLINQAKIYFDEGLDPYQICHFIEDILKRDLKIYFNHDFIGDYIRIICGWHPNRKYFIKKYMLSSSNHIGLNLYYEILKLWDWTDSDIIENINKEKELKLYLDIKNKIAGNLYRISMSDAEKMDLYLNKIESNNLPYKEIKYKLITELINIMKNNYHEIVEYFKDESKLKKARKVILSNIEFFRYILSDPILIEILGIYNKSKNMMIY